MNEVIAKHEQVLITKSTKPTKSNNYEPRAMHATYYKSIFKVYNICHASLWAWLSPAYRQGRLQRLQSLQAKKSTKSMSHTSLLEALRSSNRTGILSPSSGKPRRAFSRGPHGILWHSLLMQRRLWKQKVLSSCGQETRPTTEWKALRVYQRTSWTRKRAELSRQP